MVSARATGRQGAAAALGCVGWNRVREQEWGGAARQVASGSTGGTSFFSSRSGGGVAFVRFGFGGV
ncbi:hypothetical protein FHX44_112250 [Pseudonocardia hierapolitana]|uniref:Uncharacterized protein n=1 Tax=Pseudonocardia hierapolitana TaxID=1128676 RepID=A0A561SNC7_9PSEU|nr:hypothetical protein FHX44_112250 [Pseudonocardia hierapolitana]